MWSTSTQEAPTVQKKEITSLCIFSKVSVELQSSLDQWERCIAAWGASDDETRRREVMQHPLKLWLISVSWACTCRHADDKSDSSKSDLITEPVKLEPLLFIFQDDDVISTRVETELHHHTHTTVHTHDSVALTELHNHLLAKQYHVELIQNTHHPEKKGRMVSSSLSISALTSFCI